MRGGEAGEVAALLVRSNEENAARFPPEVAAAWLAEVEDVGGRLAFTEVLVAEHGGRIVGSVTLLPDAADDGHPWPPGGAVLRLLAVDPAARGSGVGTALTAACAARAREHGARYLALHTAPVMEAATRLYERHGFRRAPEHDFDPDRYYGGGAGGAERPPWGLAYVMELVPAPGPTRVELPPDPSSARVARRAVEEACAGAVASVDSVVLCASELVTNALLHGAPPIVLEVEAGHGGVRVAVHDAGPREVRHRRPVDAETLSGRGLTIVSVLADRWGSDPTPTGKVTWFEIDPDANGAGPA